MYWSKRFPPKELVLIFLIIAIAVSVCRGQQVSDEPFKGATKIVVACNDSELDLYTRWGKHLAMKGFGIDESNPDFLQLVTKPKDTSKLNFSYTLITTVDENVVHIAIQWRLNSSFLAGTNETSFYDWEYVNNKTGNAAGVIYNDVLALLADFDHNAVGYLK